MSTTMSPELDPRPDQWVVQVFNEPEPGQPMYCLWVFGPFDDLPEAMAHLNGFPCAGLMKLTPPPEGRVPSYVPVGVPA